MSQLRWTHDDGEDVEDGVVVEDEDQPNIEVEVKQGRDRQGEGEGQGQGQGQGKLSWLRPSPRKNDRPMFDVRSMAQGEYVST